MSTEVISNKTYPKVHPSAGNVIVAMFVDFEGVVYIELMTKGMTMTTKPISKTPHGLKKDHKISSSWQIKRWYHTAARLALNPKQLTKENCYRISNGTFDPHPSYNPHLRRVISISLKQ